MWTWCFNLLGELLVLRRGGLCRVVGQNDIVDTVPTIQVVVPIDLTLPETVDIGH